MQAEMTLPNELAAIARSPEIPESADVYGWLIGSWELDVRYYGVDVSSLGIRGEVHFGWALEGRAVQDVWILPGFFYGTTLRVYDPNLDAWHILWNDPLKQYYTRQVGRARGGDIVQEGKNDAGAAIRWSFTEIAAKSFRWRGERSLDNGATWQLQADFFARRAR